MLKSVMKPLEQYHADEYKELLRPAYKDYIHHVSSPLISLSLNRAAFLYYLVQMIPATRILDLGSGFSSYVFRECLRSKGEATVLSVDDSVQWLERTAEFLGKHGHSTEGLMTLSVFEQETLSLTKLDFDLCLVDLGDYTLRKQLLPGLFVHLLTKGGIVILDDFHDAGYRRYADMLARSMDLQVYSLRKVTRRRLSHAALVLGEIRTES